MKLEDIKKKNIYTVPDKYFDQLPTRIQARVNEKKPVFGINVDLSLVLKVAFPAVALVVVMFYFGLNNYNSDKSAADLLAQVSTEDLIAYLETTDITTQQILEEVDFSILDLDFSNDQPIMKDIEMDDQDLNILFDEYGIDGDLL